jgi:hypothetical protein
MRNICKKLGDNINSKLTTTTTHIQNQNCSVINLKQLLSTDFNNYLHLHVIVI